MSKDRELWVLPLQPAICPDMIFMGMRVNQRFHRITTQRSHKFPGGKGTPAVDQETVYPIGGCPIPTLTHKRSGKFEANDFSVPLDADHCGKVSLAFTEKG